MVKRLTWIALMLSSCYQPRLIVVPPSEDALGCVRECTDRERACRPNPMGRDCEEVLDRCMMICPGAYDSGPRERRLRGLSL